MSKYNASAINLTYDYSFHLVWDQDNAEQSQCILVRSQTTFFVTKNYKPYMHKYNHVILTSLYMHACMRVLDAVQQVYIVACIKKC